MNSNAVTNLELVSSKPSSWRRGAGVELFLGQISDRSRYLFSIMLQKSFCCLLSLLMSSFVYFEYQCGLLAVELVLARNPTRGCCGVVNKQSQGKENPTGLS